MAPLAVDPQVLDSAGTQAISAGRALDATISTLTTALDGSQGMSGDDPAGAAFGRSYDSSATTLLEAMATTRNGLCRLGDGVRISAHNYSLAEARSNIAGNSQPLPGPHPTDSIAAASTPSSVGHGSGAPAGWGWVSKYIGMIWPSGDSAKLRGAAAAWTSAGTNFEVSEILGAVGPMSSIGTQQIPEAPAITAAFSQTHRCAAQILQQCATVATHLSSYAAKIDSVHAAIIDLLSRICNPVTGFKIVWEFLTDDDEAEIKKIANDIRIIVNQFTEEVEALGRQIAAALAEAKTVITTMARYAHKEWDHFLHSTEIGRELDRFGHMCNGVIDEAESFVKGIWDLSPPRAILDPKGFWHSLSGSLEKLETLTGIDGEKKAEDAWKELGKATLHWDDWATDPLKAAGETIFDLGTLALPGGLASKLPKLGDLAGELAEAPKSPHVPTPSRLPDPAPHNSPPASGQPGSAPKPKDGLPPYGLTESRPPAEAKPSAPALKQPVESAPPGSHQPLSPTTHVAPPVPVPNDPTHGGAPSAHQPQSSATDHHGPVAPVVPTLTTGDLSAFADYSGPGHNDLNSALRNDTVDASQQARVDAINQALGKLPPHVGPVVRGTDLPPDVLARYQPDAIVTEKAFLSTSVEPGVAQSTAFSGNVEFRILSKTGRDISQYSTFPTEREVLFPSGTKFYVVDRRPDPVTGITIIEMIER